MMAKKSVHPDPKLPAPEEALSGSALTEFLDWTQEKLEAIKASHAKAQEAYQAGRAVLADIEKRRVARNDEHEAWITAEYDKLRAEYGRKLDESNQQAWQERAELRAEEDRLDREHAGLWRDYYRAVLDRYGEAGVTLLGGRNEFARGMFDDPDGDPDSGSNGSDGSDGSSGENPTPVVWQRYTENNAVDGGRDLQSPEPESPGVRKGVQADRPAGGKRKRSRS